MFTEQRDDAYQKYASEEASIERMSEFVEPDVEDSYIWDLERAVRHLTKNGLEAALTNLPADKKSQIWNILNNLNND